MTMELVQKEMDFEEGVLTQEPEPPVQQQDERIAQCLAAIKDTLDRHGCVLNVTFMPVINVIRREENATA